MKKLCFLLLFIAAACTSSTKNSGSALTLTERNKNNERIVWTYHIKGGKTLSSYDKKAIGETFTLGHKKSCYNSYSSSVQAIGYKIRTSNNAYIMDVICLKNKATSKEYPGLKILYSR